MTLSIVSFGGESLHSLLDEAAVGVGDDGHAAWLQDAIHLGEDSAGVGHVLDAECHGHEVEGVVIPRQLGIGIEVLDMAFGGLLVSPELALVQTMNDDASALKGFLGVVRDPRGAEVQNREALGNGGEDASVGLGEAPERGLVEVVHQARLGVHGGVRGLVDPGEVARGEGPLLGHVALLRRDRERDRGVGDALLDADVLAVGAGDGHADEGCLREDRLEGLLPLFNGLQTADFDAVARNAFTEHKVGNLADSLRQALVLLPDARAARLVEDEVAGLLGQSELPSDLREDLDLGDVLSLLEVDAREGLEGVVLLADLCRGRDEHEGVEGVDDAAVRVQKHAGLLALDAEGVLLGVRVLLAVAVVAEQIVVQTLSFFGHVGVEEDRVVAEDRILVQTQILQCSVHVELTQK
mmetsp:Transcript_98828/g.206014  ORF Transcript_98828/g.206014 Transcript_98828/m.206014 type:complete len:410 (-) Transcript_98828:843-2072(-)